MPGELAPDRRNMRVSHEDRDHVAEQLRVAAGDGRLDADELDQRLEAALTARTYGELEVLLTDLPTASGPARAPVPVPAAKELIELTAEHSGIRRDGRWVVPRRLAVQARHGNVTIDFTQAIITAPTLELSVSSRHSNVVLIVPPEVTVDVDDITSGHGVVRQRVHHDPDLGVKLRITASGNIRHGNFVVRGPRARRRGRSFWDWLLRRQPAPLTAREGRRGLGR